MAINTVYHFVNSNLGVGISSKKRAPQIKGKMKWKIEALLYTLFGFLRKFQDFLLFFGDENR